MSKIAFSPNDSGTGTFTIESPPTNDNRTLELPDEAGKVLTTGNDNPAEVFKQSNILGTVSESAGVPTGAIIERGSNVNGEFVKFADGTLIAHHQDTFDATDTGVQLYPFPVNYAGAPISVSFSGANGNIGITQDSSRTVISRLGQNWRLRTGTAGTNDDVTVSMTAIGRWF